MTTGTTTLLSLALPVEGELDGTWGDVVNYGITDYVDIAVAGTLTLNGDGAVTLVNTSGDAAGTNIGATTAQYAIIKITGTLTATKVITAPSSSKTYIVDNTTATFGVTFKAAGQTGVTVIAGEKCTVYYNGTDYVKVASTVADGVTSVTGTSPVVSSGGNTPAISLAAAYGDTLNPYASKTANNFLAAPNGSAGVPSFRAVVAADIPTLNQNTTGTAASTPKLLTTNFTIEESGGNLIFKYGSTTIASMTSAGVFTTLSDINGNGTP
jgi:hypothetical protein